MAKPTFLTKPIVAIEKVDDKIRVATWAAPAVAWRLQYDMGSFDTIDEARAAASLHALKHGYAIAMDMGAATTPPRRLSRG